MRVQQLGAVHGYGPGHRRLLLHQSVRSAARARAIREVAPPYRALLTVRGLRRETIASISRAARGRFTLTHLWGRDAPLCQLADDPDHSVGELGKFLRRNGEGRREVDRHAERSHEHPSAKKRRRRYALRHQAATQLLSVILQREYPLFNAHHARLHAAIGHIRAATRDWPKLPHSHGRGAVTKPPNSIWTLRYGGFGVVSSCRSEARADGSFGRCIPTMCAGESRRRPWP